MNNINIEKFSNRQFIVIADCADGQVMISKDGRFSFELDEAIAIRDDHRGLCKGVEVNVCMVHP